MTTTVDHFGLAIKALVGATLLSGSGYGNQWHLTICRLERRGDPACACIPECTAARDALRLIGRLP